MKLTFLGGAGTVTGSKYLVESGASRILFSGDLGRPDDPVMRPSARPGRVFVTHGEPVAAESLAQRIRRDLGLQANVPKDGATVAIGDNFAP